MSEQTKRGPGRPPLKDEDKEQTRDTHLNLPLEIIRAIDAVRGNRNRKAFILEAVQEKIERER